MINAKYLGLTANKLAVTASKLDDENAKLLLLVNDMLACFRIGAERNGISKQWCYELFDTYAGKLRELGIEVK